MCDGLRDELAKWPLVRTCTSAERRIIARTADYMHAPAGALVSCDNERLNPVVIVAHGKICVIEDDGVTTVGEGAVVGAAEVLTGRARSADVVTATDADLVLIEPRRFLPMLERCPNFTVELLRTLARESLAAPA